MDDSSFLLLAKQGGPLGFNSFYDDPGSGFLRTTSWIVSWPAYWAAGWLGSGALYLINAVLVVGIVLVFGAAAKCFFGWRSQWTFAAFIAATFIWPYTAELFAFPSLQEKSILLGAGLLLWWVSRGIRVKNWLGSYSLLIFISILAFNTKTQITLFIPGLLLALVLSTQFSSTLPKDRYLARRMTAGALWFLCSLSLIILALRGSYTVGTRGGEWFHIPTNSALAGLAALTFTYSIILLIRRHRGYSISADLIAVVWPITTLFAFSIWDLRNYYLAVVGVMFAVLIANILNWSHSRRFPSVVALALIVASSIWMLLRIPMFFEATASINNFLNDPITSQLNSTKALIEVSCEEAPIHFNRYAQDRGLLGLTFVTGDPANTQEGPARYVLADERLCPLAIQVIDPPVWTDGSRYGYQLFLVEGDES